MAIRRNQVNEAKLNRIADLYLTWKENDKRQQNRVEEMADFPSVDEFKRALLIKSLDQVVKDYVFEGLPYVFRDTPQLMKTLRSHLCNSLSISAERTIIIGSAKTGFSLSPDTVFRQFSDESDIDILVVDEKIFDDIWKIVLSWHYPRRIGGLGGLDASWGGRRRRDLYWGWFVPDKIRYEGLSFPEVLKPLRDISTAWFNAFRSLSRFPEFSRRNITGRLYRTWDHALLYHADGLRQIKEGLVETKKDAWGDMNYNATEHPLSWFRDRYRDNTLKIKPPYQRKPVWAARQKCYLIESILMGLPVPEIYIQQTTSPEGETTYAIVDGQQRIRTVLQFIGSETDPDVQEFNKFVLDKLDESSKWKNSSFADLEPEEKRTFYGYRFAVRYLT
jgi:Protein of unknown function DUF262